MRGKFLIAVLLAAISVGTALTAAQTARDRNKEIVDQLGPEPLWGPPPTLARLVAIAPAAVIGEMVGPGQIRVDHVKSPKRAELGTRGYAGYRVTVREVLYNRAPAGSPPLTAGQLVEFSQIVGRRDAEAFISGHHPVRPGTECVFFLWNRPDVQEWSLLQWPLQFCESKGLRGAAESAGRPDELEWLNHEWLGASVPLMAKPGGGVTPVWEGFKTEVKRLGGKGGRPTQVNDRVR